ncbi:MAG TPA: aspartate carbamoyltransferase catalytic subunit [Bacteroidota bacterium]|nr:aspartate carbamoyltransferase catalytic subunit [Bacteroidota bacterium]
MKLHGRHLLGLDGMPREDIQLILDTAVSFKEVLERPIKKVPPLQGKTIANMFFESSTRTRLSFELAERRLSADVVSFTTAGSSVAKGETLKDTARNIEAMKIDMVVIRHSAPGAAHFLSRVVNANVINAGDGSHEHPTQALLDMFTLREKHGSLDGLRVCIVGDITHSRVARSNIFGLKTMGAEVSVCGPATLIPREIENLGVKVYHRLEDVVQDVDALNVLRIQLERQQRGLFPSLREYHRYFGVTKEKLARATKPITIMHPGPINRDVEISADLADGEHSVILQQVTNGVAVRMAVLYLLGISN